MSAISDVATLRSSFTGSVLAPGDDGYDQARKVWNEEIDRRPAVIAQCATAEDVVRAVTFGAEEGLELAVRGGAHAPAGMAVVDIVILPIWVCISVLTSLPSSV